MIAQKVGILKAFPVDIISVKKIGVEKWQKTFFWPVTDSEYFLLCAEVEDAFQKEIEDSNQTFQEILVSSIGLTRQYALLFHAQLVIKRLQEMGYEVICDEKSDYYWTLLNGKIRDNSSYKYKKKELINNIAKSFIKFIIFNKFTSRENFLDLEIKRNNA